MNSTHFIHANDLISASIVGTIDLGDLEYELINLALDIDPHADRFIDSFIGRAVIVLSEMDRGDRTVESVMGELRQLAKYAQSIVQAASPATPPLLLTTVPLLDNRTGDVIADSVTAGRTLRLIHRTIEPFLKPAPVRSILHFG